MPLPCAKIWRGFLLQAKAVVVLLALAALSSTGLPETSLSPLDAAHYTGTKSLLVWDLADGVAFDSGEDDDDDEDCFDSLRFSELRSGDWDVTPTAALSYQSSSSHFGGILDANWARRIDRRPTILAKLTVFLFAIPPPSATTSV